MKVRSSPSTIDKYLKVLTLDSIQALASLSENSQLTLLNP